METRAAVQLAEEILTDHFGDIVGRVGVVLLERGPLALSELIRFTSESKNFTDEPLKFPQLRNALLAMVQNCIVTTKPHPHAQFGVPIQPQIYTIHINEILCRCRFPHYLEVISWTKGEDAQQMLLTILLHGRIKQSLAIAETRQETGISIEQARKALQDLVRDGLVLAVAPSVTVESEPSNDAQSQPGAELKQELKQETDSKRQKISDGEPAAPAPAMKTDPVWCLNRRALNLCLYKRMLERIVEHRLGQRAAQACSILLEGVPLPESGQPIRSQFMRFPEICDRWDQAHHEPGRDPEKEHEALKIVLNQVKDEMGGAVRLRQVHVHQGSSAGAEVAEWIVEWPKVKEVLRGAVRSQLLRDRFGEMGLRIFNLLNEKDTPQKLEENEIFHVCMIPQTDGREMLNAMVKSHIINLQEVSRGASMGASSSSATGVNMGMSYWLYYIDRTQVEETLLQTALKAMLNLRIRFRVESMKSPALESRVQSLSQEEKRRLAQFRRREDVLERSFLLLDAVLLGLECA